ncbi:hypothetical protein ACJMK2_036080 [Sinanodonta woodiana]|uniref:BPTI/Kunitz inhibitor domain-containing protein n=1 Tax=Sinanodonta woodiana TaxID=1069815 RepID=A0ABD3WG34_SINWO
MLTMTTCLLTFTLAFCLLAVDGAIIQPPESTDHPNTTPFDPSVCHLPSNPGPCKGFFPRYFFDVKTLDCKEFIWGGCGGNQNNFETGASCIAACAS